MLEPMTAKERATVGDKNLGAMCADLEFYGFTPMDDPMDIIAWLLLRLDALPMYEEETK